MVYDQLADRWVITQFASATGGTPITDECIAVSQTGNAAGGYFRYGYHLGSDFFDYPHFGVWPDAYYMSMNVFNSSGTAFLGPQPFAFNSSAMLTGSPGTFITSRDSSFFNRSSDALLPADLDGTHMPPSGAPNPYMMGGENTSAWKIWRFHVDFGTPANSTFTLAGNLTPAAYTELCWSGCVPQAGTTATLAGLGDRAMFRSAYRRFPDGHEALVGNQSVCVGGTVQLRRPGIRWWEISGATSGTPAWVQQSTYAPNDGVWRWMGSAAMDQSGDLAIGFSASNASMVPAIRYAGRLASDPLNDLSQGEATLFAGQGSQTGTNSRWGDYSDLTVDPSDDCTYWYTQEYYPAGVSWFNWRTRIGNFKFPTCAPPPPPPPPPPSATTSATTSTSAAATSASATTSAPVQAALQGSERGR